MGGFGSSNSGFGGYSSSSLGGSSGGGSALSKLDLGGKARGSSLGGFGNTDSLRNSRYDDDLDAGHQALTTDDLDDEGEVCQSMPSLGFLWFL